MQPSTPNAAPYLATTPATPCGKMMMSAPARTLAGAHHAQQQQQQRGIANTTSSCGGQHPSNHSISHHTTGRSARLLDVSLDHGEHHPSSSHSYHDASHTSICEDGRGDYSVMSLSSIADTTFSMDTSVGPSAPPSPTSHLERDLHLSTPPSLHFSRILAPEGSPLQSGGLATPSPNEAVLHLNFEDELRPRVPFHRNSTTSPTPAHLDPVVLFPSGVDSTRTTPVNQPDSSRSPSPSLCCFPPSPSIARASPSASPTAASVQLLSGSRANLVPGNSAFTVPVDRTMARPVTRKPLPAGVTVASSEPAPLWGAGQGRNRYDEDFQALEQIGTGNTSRVYKVRKRLDGMLYAVKVQSLRGERDRRKRLLEVHALAASTNHKHIVQYFDAWIELETLYIRLEHCCGGSVASRFGLDQWKWTEAELMDLLHQVSCGLQHLHSQQMAHMDMKMENIYITQSKDPAEPTWVYKIGDLGLVCFLDDIPEFDLQEGDVRYLDKRLLNHGDHLKEADVFSLGASVYELARNWPLPMNGAEWHSIRSGVLPGLEHLHPELSGLISSMMHEEPCLRPTASDLMAKCDPTRDNTDRGTPNQIHEFEVEIARLKDELNLLRKSHF
eukprot:TRINITY_DN2572_c2_g1_i1.p1 TRINITY_DN2572_c2_g1~~TRINITY_DN2572_c2_g1_i1.p1  ORF type:complete len:629 (-),score=101.34 TRINITY_DN2572_c2_g1_i1:385-2223(-)